MSDKPSLTTEVGTIASKYAAGPGLSVIGMVTLNDLALVAGLFCSVVIAGHTLWKWWCDIQDRRARQAANLPPLRYPEDE